MSLQWLSQSVPIEPVANNLTVKYAYFNTYFLLLSAKGLMVIEFSPI